MTEIKQDWFFAKWDRNEDGVVDGEEIQKTGGTTAFVQDLHEYGRDQGDEIKWGLIDGRPAIDRVLSRTFAEGGGRRVLARIKRAAWRSEPSAGTFAPSGDVYKVASRYTPTLGGDIADWLGDMLKRKG